MRVVIACVALVVTLAGCGGAANKSTQGQAGTKTGGAAQGGALTFGQTAGVPQLDPNTISTAAAQQLLTLLWNGLAKWGPGDTTEPDLAESWTPNADYTSWTFKLRAGVKFHDGRAFTAADAVKNIERVLDPKVAAQVRAKLDTITKSTAVDDTTLRIDLKKPNPNLPNALIELKMTDVDHIADVNKNANGTGPYKLKSFVPDQTVELVRNDAYFGGKPKLDSIKIARYADKTAAETAFRSGEIDVLWNLPADSANSLGAQILEPPAASSAAAWELDTSSKPFSDVRARQALSYAMNRQAMVQAAYGGHGVVNTANVIVNPKSKYFNQSLPAYDFNLDKAKQLFAEAGVKQGDKLTFWTTAGDYPEWATMGEILQQDLKKIGIDLDIKKSEIATWSAKFYPAPKKYPGLIAANYLSFPSLPSTYSLVWAGSSGTCECNWKPPKEYDDAIKVIETTADDAKRGPAFAKLQEILNKESPIVVVANTAWISVAQPKVRDAWVQGDGGVHVENAGVAAG